jgi:type II secretory pathway pseudopilin PulG
MRNVETNHSHRARRGAALLEVLVALSILSVAGLAVVAFAIETTGVITRARIAEGELRRASALLDAVALWPREDLDRHLGDRPQGPWRMQVDRRTRALYTVVLTDSTGSRELVRTALYRPFDDERALDARP